VTPITLLQSATVLERVHNFTYNNSRKLLSNIYYSHR